MRVLDWALLVVLLLYIAGGVYFSDVSGIIRVAGSTPLIIILQFLLTLPVLLILVWWWNFKK